VAQRVKAGRHHVVMAVTAMCLEHREPHSSYRWPYARVRRGTSAEIKSRGLVVQLVTYDAPFAVKVRMAASNTFIKLRKRQACCGNNGQPGC